MLTFLHICNFEKRFTDDGLRLHSPPSAAISSPCRTILFCLVPRKLLKRPTSLHPEAPLWVHTTLAFLPPDPASFLCPLSTLQSEAASKNANLMVSWQLKIFWDFPSRIKSHALNKKRWQFPHIFLCCFPLTSLFFRYTGPPPQCCCCCLECSSCRGPTPPSFRTHCSLLSRPPGLG